MWVCDLLLPQPKWKEGFVSSVMRSMHNICLENLTRDEHEPEKCSSVWFVVCLIHELQTVTNF